jgi:hypothetical protein
VEYSYILISIAFSTGDTGWEIFSLDYSVDAPLTALIHPDAIATYRTAFHMLWRLKRVEWSLSGTEIVYTVELLCIVLRTLIQIFFISSCMEGSNGNRSPVREGRDVEAAERASPMRAAPQSYAPFRQQPQRIPDV